MKWKMLDWCDVLVVRGESEREDGLFADNGGALRRVFGLESAGYLGHLHAKSRVQGRQKTIRLPNCVQRTRGIGVLRCVYICVLGLN